MPRICEFHGIVIYIHWREHNPPHFHAVLADSELLVRIDNLRRYEGHLPRNAERLVWRWAAMHVDELLANWDLAQAGLTPRPIDPLD